MINSKIKAIFTNLNIPTSFMENQNPTSNYYAVFQIYNESDSYYSDDGNEAVDYNISVDYWYNSGTAGFSKINDIKNALKQAGFFNIVSKDLYDDTTKFYGKNFDFEFTEFAVNES